MILAKWPAISSPRLSSQSAKILRGRLSRGFLRASASRSRPFWSWQKSGSGIRGCFLSKVLGITREAGAKNWDRRLRGEVSEMAWTIGRDPWPFRPFRS